MTTKELIELYISLKRIFYNKPIPIPKENTATWEELNRLRILLEEKAIPGDEFILVNVRAYRRMKVFPRPNQLLGIKAFNRYNEYVSRRYKFGKLFKVDPHSALIYKTGIYYPIEEFIKPFDNDLKALMVFAFVKESKVSFEETKLKKIKECYHYLLAKYEWFKRIPPDSLLQWKEKVDATRKE